MANPVTVNIKGLDELQAKLEALDTNVAKKGLRTALKDGGKVIQKQIELRSPDRTGFLRKHFNTKISMRGHEDLAGAAYVGPDKAVYPKDLGERELTETLHMPKKDQKRILKEHKGRISVISVCRFLEFGTTKMPKKPFITAAFKSVGQNAIDAVIKAIKEAIDEVR